MKHMEKHNCCEKEHKKKGEHKEEPALKAGSGWRKERKR